MPLLDAEARLAPDPYTLVADDAPLPEGPALVTLARLRAEPALAGRNAALGVLLSAGDDPAALAPWLPRLALVAVPFGKFRDGRGFTQARSLREYHGFKGEVRATGHVLPDQFRMLLRCGVSTVQVAEGTDAALWARARDKITHRYQYALAG